MSEKEMVEQIKSLISDRKSFITKDKDSEIFKKDAEALEKILDEYETLKMELSGYRQAILQDKEMLGLKESLQQRDSIIEEAIEYIKTHRTIFEPEIDHDELLEILNKYKGENNG